MSSALQVMEGAATGVAVTDMPESLGAFRQPDCAAALWRRQIPSDVQRWLNALDRDDLPSGRLTVPLKDVAGVVGQLCTTSGLLVGPEREWLERDIAALAQIFCGVMETDQLRLRLDVVTTNACRKFHIDAVTARLVCTYRGPGTQYGVAAPGQEPSRVFTAPTGAPILLRGSQWPDGPPPGLLHRSPPIEDSGETRLVLVLDPVFATDGAI